MSTNNINFLQNCNMFVKNLGYNFDSEENEAKFVQELKSINKNFNRVITILNESLLDTEPVNIEAQYEEICELCDDNSQILELEDNLLDNELEILKEEDKNLDFELMKQTEMIDMEEKEFESLNNYLKFSDHNNQIKQEELNSNLHKFTNDLNSLKDRLKNEIRNIYAIISEFDMNIKFIDSGDYKIIGTRKLNSKDFSELISTASDILKFIESQNANKGIDSDTIVIDEYIKEFNKLMDEFDKLYSM
jgi:hypothetical protein